MFLSGNLRKKKKMITYIFNHVLVQVLQCSFLQNALKDKYNNDCNVCMPEYSALIINCRGHLCIYEWILIGC